MRPRTDIIPARHWKIAPRSSHSYHSYLRSTRIEAQTPRVHDAISRNLVTFSQKAHSSVGVFTRVVDDCRPLKGYLEFAKYARRLSCVWFSATNSTTPRSMSQTTVTQLCLRRMAFSSTPIRHSHGLLAPLPTPYCPVANRLRLVPADLQHLAGAYVWHASST